MFLSSNKRFYLFVDCSSFCPPLELSGSAAPAPPQVASSGCLIRSVAFLLTSFWVSPTKRIARRWLPFRRFSGQQMHMLGITTSPNSRKSHHLLEKQGAVIVEPNLSPVASPLLKAHENNGL